jgi:hypothetical protein
MLGPSKAAGGIANLPRSEDHRRADLIFDALCISGRNIVFALPP